MTAADSLAPGVHHRIGEIPNPLALAHWLTTTPLVHDGVVFVVLENEIDRRLVIEGLRLFNDKLAVTEWTGGLLQLASLPKDCGVIVADRVTMEDDRLPGMTSFAKQCLTVSVGDDFSLRDLQELLTDHGFDRETTANDPGRWAARGEVLDIYLDAPLRLQFDGNTIESIRQFELGDGSLGANRTELTIPNLKQAGRSSLLDHLSVDLPVIVFHEEALPILNPQFLIEAVRLPDGQNAGYADARSYHLRHEELAADAKEAKAVFILTEELKRGRSLLTDGEVTVSPISLPTRGFVHEPTGTLVLTDLNIGFGEAEQKRKQAKLAQEMVQQLVPGDLVAHLYHGIARFGGTKRMFVNEMDREYFQLEYAGGDKIYVPVELAERIDKYLGDPDPKLHRLSDASWNEAVMKVKAHALEMARELLDLYARRSVARAPQLAKQPEEGAFDAACPYELTWDQLTAWQAISHDLAQDQPMDRLLCGDVGFGKTEVALRAALRAVLNGYQVALLAPTTILVQQHFDTFVERLKDFDVRVGQLSRFMTAKEQREVITGLADGSVQVVVGTHRLISKDVHFKRLGLIIVDEEQRFGVKAKEGLKRLRTSAHVLSMTATPIPRTLHLSLSGVRDVSTILTAPEERKAVELIIQPLDEATIRTAVGREMERGGQTYYLYNRVQSIERRAQELRAIVPKARIGIAHGQMQPGELAAVMHRFDVGEVDLLLATTIIENGLDIPNANTLIVENSSRFGLSELYQLKGRVGRSSRQGYAYLLYTERVPEADAKKRYVALQSARALGSGFELAMKDMEIRGVGNILGKKQHGHAVRIGLHLYLRLLNQAVQELQGMELVPEREIPIDLPIESRIPEELLPAESDRIMLYQQLASIRDVGELQKKRDKFTAEGRFGQKQLHPLVAGLFDVLEIKLLAAQSALLSINTTYPNEQNGLDSPVITLDSDQPFPELAERWEPVFGIGVEGFRVRASVAALGENWVARLKETIRRLERGREL